MRENNIPASVPASPVSEVFSSGSPPSTVRTGSHSRSSSVQLPNGDYVEKRDGRLYFRRHRSKKSKRTSGASDLEEPLIRVNRPPRNSHPGMPELPAYDALSPGFASSQHPSGSQLPGQQNIMVPENNPSFWQHGQAVQQPSQQQPRRILQPVDVHQRPQSETQPGQAPQTGGLFGELPAGGPLGSHPINTSQPHPILQPPFDPRPSPRPTSRLQPPPPPAHPRPTPVQAVVPADQVQELLSQQAQQQETIEALEGRLHERDLELRLASRALAAWQRDQEVWEAERRRSRTRNLNHEALRSVERDSQRRAAELARESEQVRGRIQQLEDDIADIHRNIDQAKHHRQTLDDELESLRGHRVTDRRPAAALSDESLDRRLRELERQERRHRRGGRRQ